MRHRDMATRLRAMVPNLQMVPEDEPTTAADVPAAVFVRANDGQYCWLKVDGSWDMATAVASVERLLELVEAHGGAVAKESQDDA